MAEAKQIVSSTGRVWIEVDGGWRAGAATLATGNGTYVLNIAGLRRDLDEHDILVAIEDAERWLVARKRWLEEADEREALTAIVQGADRTGWIDRSAAFEVAGHVLTAGFRRSQPAPRTVTAEQVAEVLRRHYPVHDWDRAQIVRCACRWSGRPQRDITDAEFEGHQAEQIVVLGIEVTEP